MKLDKLLYILCEKGWKPYGISRVKNVVALNHCINFSKRTIFGIEFFEYTLRSLVSKESGLWQFCVENKLVNKYADISDEEEAYIGKWKSGLDAIDIDGNYIRLDDDYDEYHQDTDYKYWLIQSSLIDEDRLEQFLLENIKV